MLHSPRTNAPPLTHDLLVKVLALAWQKHRLTGCALVSTAWHAAAVAASSKIELFTRSPDKLDCFLLYLHGVRVAGISMSTASGAAAWLSLMEPLPASCSKLQELKLRSCEVQLASVLSNLASLTRLDVLNSSPSPAAPAGLAPLSQLATLQRLKCSLKKGEEGLPFPAGVLSHLTRLTHLDLEPFKVDEPAVRGIDSLANLQHLQLGPLCWFAVPSGPSFDEDEAKMLTTEALSTVSGLQ